MLKKIDKNLETIPLIVITTFMTILIFVQVIMRYVFESSLSWSEELARYLFVWMAYLAVSLGIKEMKHIKIDAALYLFPKKARKYVVLIGDVIVLCFAAFVVISSFQMVAKLFSFGQVSAALSIPMWIVYLAPAVGFTLTVFRSFQVIAYRINEIKEKREEEAAS